jgi:hypothetical protein
MANKVLLKKSSTAAKTPLVTDLDYGELALNYADGKLYYKTSGNTIDTFPSLSATATLTNKTLTSPTINSGALSGTFSGAITLSDTTASTSTTTGALKIGGGLGVAGSIYADKIYAINNGAGTNVYVGDDVVLGDVNQANTLGVRGQQDASQGYIVFGNANNTNYIGRSGTNPLQVTGQFKVDSGTITGASAVAMQIAGYANKGGTGYHDFLSVTNGYGSATNASKWFRLNSTGGLEIINSAYTTNIFTLNDAGQLTIPSLSLAGTITDSLSSVGTNGQILQSTGTGVKWITSAAAGGTVTSVAATVPAFLSVSGSPITTSGTLAITLSGTALPVANGGTGVTTSTGSGANVLGTAPTINNLTVTGTLTANSSAGTSGYFLQSTGTGVQWAQATSTSVFTANAQSDLGYVYDASVTIIEDLGTPLGTTTTSYDLAVLRVDGVVSLENLDSSVKSDYLAQAIIFGF